jgi:limonene-1,2-epoxide hydrolase
LYAPSSRRGSDSTPTSSSPTSRPTPSTTTCPGPRFPGRTTFRELLAWILAGHDSLHFDILTLVAAGDVVVAERVDHLTAGDIRVALPVVGIFELRDGLIAAWRDYFDPTPVEPLLAVLRQRQKGPA